MSIPVWQGFDLDVAIFEEDDSGNPIGMSDPTKYVPDTDTPLFTYCFFQEATVNGELEATRRPVLGRSAKKIVADQYVYTCSVNSFFFLRREVDRTKVFHREQRLRIVMRYFNLIREHEHNNYQYILVNAIAKNFTIGGSENDIHNASCTFWAEDVIEHSNES